MGHNCVPKYNLGTRKNKLTLQIEPSRFRHHFAKCRVAILEHLDGTYAVIWKKRVIGRYDVKGQILRINPARQPPDPRSLSLWGPEKRSKMRKGKPSGSPSSRTSRRRSGRSPALPYPPLRRLNNMAIALKNQPDILCAMITGHLYVLLTPANSSWPPSGVSRLKRHHLVYGEYAVILSRLGALAGPRSRPASLKLDLLPYILIRMRKKTQECPWQ